MNPETDLSQLKNKLNEYKDLSDAAALLRWDRETQMPPGGTAGRGHQLATLARIAHLKFTSDEIGQLLENLQSYAGEIDQDSDDARLIRVTNRLYKKRSKVPASLMAEIAKTASDAHPIWERARENSRFSDFQPYLESLIDANSTGNLAGVLIEPYQGAAGFIFPPICWCAMASR